MQFHNIFQANDAASVDESILQWVTEEDITAFTSDHISTTEGYISYYTHQDQSSVVVSSHEQLANVEEGKLVFEQGKQAVEENSSGNSQIEIKEEEHGNQGEVAIEISSPLSVIDTYTNINDSGNQDFMDTLAISMAESEQSRLQEYISPNSNGQSPPTQQAHALTYTIDQHESIMHGLDLVILKGQLDAFCAADNADIQGNNNNNNSHKNENGNETTCAVEAAASFENTSNFFHQPDTTATTSVGQDTYRDSFLPPATLTNLDMGAFSTTMSQYRGSGGTSSNLFEYYPNHAEITFSTELCYGLGTGPVNLKEEYVIPEAPTNGQAIAAADQNKIIPRSTAVAVPVMQQDTIAPASAPASINPQKQLPTPEEPHSNSASASNATNADSPELRKYDYDLSSFNSSPLKHCTMFNAGKSTTVAEYRNLRLVILTPGKPIPAGFPKPDSLKVLDHVRQPNQYTLNDCYNHPSYRADAKYTEENAFNGYAAKIRRVYNVWDKKLVKKKITEGLCPYCVNFNWLKIKNSAYGHHLAVQHGVQTNGANIPDPIDHGLYYCEKKYKINWTNSVFEAVRCPTEGCNTICKLSKYSAENPNRLLDYLRHHRDHHKTGVRIDCKKEQQAGDDAFKRRKLQPEQNLPHLHSHPHPHRQPLPLPQQESDLQPHSHLHSHSHAHQYSQPPQQQQQQSQSQERYSYYDAEFFHSFVF